MAKKRKGNSLFFSLSFGIWDGKKSYPRSGINISDSQHCMQHCFLNDTTEWFEYIKSYITLCLLQGRGLSLADTAGEDSRESWTRRSTCCSRSATDSSRTFYPIWKFILISLYRGPSVKLFLFIPNFKAVIVILAVLRILSVNVFVICVEVLPRITDPDFSIADPGSRGQRRHRSRIWNNELKKNLS